jgi:hypothetical protein
MNVECDTDENFKDDQFHSFSCYYVPLRAESQILASKCIFSSILILFTLIFCLKGYHTEFKDSLFEVL